MNMAMVLRQLKSAGTLFGAEALSAAKLYLVAAIFGAVVAIVSVKAGHPIFSLLPTEREAPQVTPKLGVHPPPPAPRRPTEDGNGTSRLPDYIARYEKVTPKSPDDVVVGTKIFDNHGYVGRVTHVTEAPLYAKDSAGNVYVKETKHYVTIEDTKGVAQTVDYGGIEWKAASTKVSSPEVGVLLDIGAPSK